MSWLSRRSSRVRRRRLLTWLLIAALGGAAGACNWRGADTPLGAYAVGPLRATVVPAPCSGAQVVLAADGSRFEIEPLPGVPAGSTIRIRGTVYPEASICREYPWLRLERNGVARGGFGIDFERSIPRAWAHAAELAADRAEARLPVQPSELLQLELTGPAATLRRARQALATLAARWAPARAAELSEDDDEADPADEPRD